MRAIGSNIAAHAWVRYGDRELFGPCVRRGEQDVALALRDG
jgi:hypothetical protein